MLDRPILVTGSPRSGKTLVAEILAGSPEFYFACEPLMLWDAVLPSRHDDRCSAADANSEAGQRLRQSLAGCVDRAGKRRYVDDLAQHSLRIPFIAAALPEARIIHVVRDGRSVLPELMHRWSLRDTLRAAIRRRWRHAHVRSLPRHLARFARNYWSTRFRSKRVVWGPRVPGMEEFAARHSVYESAAFQWSSLVDIARRDLAELPASAWIEVRYEQLVADPGKTALRIAEFCGAADPLACRAAADRLVRPSWRDPLGSDRQDIPWDKVGEMIAATQRALAYPVVTSGVPNAGPTV